MKIIKSSEVLLDGGTIEEIVTDIGVFKRDNKKAYYRLAKNGNYYLHSNRCEGLDRKIEEYFINRQLGFKAECFAKPKEEKFKSNYIFELDKIEEENLANYLNKLKKKYGSYGFITYKFTPTGIGTVIKVRSSHKNKSKDITNLSSW